VSITNRALWMRLTCDRGEAQHIEESVRALKQNAYLPGRWDQVQLKGNRPSANDNRQTLASCFEPWEIVPRVTMTPMASDLTFAGCLVRVHQGG